MEGNSPRDVVADETKPRNLRIRFHDPPQGALSVLGHRIGFIQDDQLEGRLRVNFAVSTSIQLSAPDSSSELERERETDDAAPDTCLGVSLANVLIFSLTTEIPRSSEAFSSNTRARNKSGLRQVAPSVQLPS